MKIFKTTDERFAELGYRKTYEDQRYGATYEKYNPNYRYVHEIEILHKQSGNHIVISSEKGVNIDGFNNAVGLNYLEIKLCERKMKEFKWYKRKGGKA